MTILTANEVRNSEENFKKTIEILEDRIFCNGYRAGFIKGYEIAMKLRFKDSEESE